MRSKSYYPIFADLNGRRCLVVGGGLVAQRKVTTLLRYGALVTVVSPNITRRIRSYARQRRLRYLARGFRVHDLRGVWLVIGATNDSELNQRIFRNATRAHIFTNIVDELLLCSFIAPSIVRRDPLTIAISTGGASPSMAKKLRRELERAIGADYSKMLRLLRSLRGIAKRRLPSYNERKRYFDRLVHGKVFQLVRSGKTDAARREAFSLLSEAAGNGAG